MDFKEKVDAHLAEGSEICNTLDGLVRWLEEWENSLELDSYFWELGYGEVCTNFRVWDGYIVADFKYVMSWEDWETESSFKLPVSWVDMFVSGEFRELEAVTTTHLAELRERETSKELADLAINAGAFGYKLVKI